ncbi:MAG: hypothetical protein V1648_03965 [Candidatus Aenigmatarchaeota archaeon]
MSHATAQEDEEKIVCLVYFTSNGCGDECRFTDTFMSGLMREYAGTLVSIIYFVDDSAQNSVVFNAYRSTYNLPANVPIVLFGKDDYLQGRSDIYEGTEKKIFDFLLANGTNCPLDSGFVAPSQLSPGSVPGAQILRMPPDKEAVKNDSIGTISEDDDVMNGNDSGPGDILALNEPMKESVFSLVIIGIVLIVVAAIIIYVWTKTQESL